MATDSMTRKGPDSITKKGLDSVMRKGPNIVGHAPQSASVQCNVVASTVTLLDRIPQKSKLTNESLTPTMIHPNRMTLATT
jgi:hypothetical protein